MITKHRDSVSFGVTAVTAEGASPPRCPLSQHHAHHLEKLSTALQGLSARGASIMNTDTAKSKPTLVSNLS